MANVASLHSHAIDRLQERFDQEKSWLLSELEGGRFVWLKGSGHSSNARKVRSGHLLYIPHRDEYCIVVMDDRSRLAITVLTEEMAQKSSWAQGLDERAKLKAKRIALGKEIIDDGSFLRLYAEERGGLSVNLCARAFSLDWRPIVVSLCKTIITAEQIDPENNLCTLTINQAAELSRSLKDRAASMEMQLYCELYASTANGKSVPLSNTIDGARDFGDAENARRWGL